MTKRLLLSFFALIICISVYAGGGKIVFSKSPINETTGADLPSITFEVGDKIYCRAFMEKPLSQFKGLNHSGDKANAEGYFAHVYIDNFDGSDKFYFTKTNYTPNRADVASEQIRNSNTFEFILNEGEVDKDSQVELSSIINSLSDGLHNVKIVIWGSKGSGQDFVTKNPIAIGEFKLNKKAGAKLKGSGLSDVVEAKMKNPALEAKAIKKLSESFQTKPNTNQCKIVSEDWIIAYSATGAIVGRGIDVAIVHKGGSSPGTENNCYLEIFRLYQDYNGSGYQDSFSRWSPIDERSGQSLLTKYFGRTVFPIDCD